MDSETKAGIARRFIEAIPFCAALGMRIDAVGDGVAELSMPYAPGLIGDPERGVIHGGAVSALMDTCGGTAVVSHPRTALSSATINLRIDYMRGATPGARIIARAECYHVTRAVAFIRATARDAENSAPLAMAAGTFTVDRG